MSCFVLEKCTVLVSMCYHFYFYSSELEVMQSIQLTDIVGGLSTLYDFIHTASGFTALASIDH